VHIMAPILVKHRVVCVRQGRRVALKRSSRRDEATPCNTFDVVEAVEGYVKQLEESRLPSDGCPY
jgi:hypothetical protein